ncbi:hypothetical protein OEZ85_004596 [Tetradesmus obliquus]|uniref:Uncharacterized protein n=1 Tax=Tetradesmus obliquus TaxID=3088 RepID=A0ABY8UPS2_TETOB|nr:hypothetical protein OEZ85_004596 [Tetradesmus obliquus]
MVYSLAVLVKRVLVGELQPAAHPTQGSSCWQQLLDCLTRLLQPTYDAAHSDSGSPMAAADALSLAQQLTAAGLCPVLGAELDTAEQTIQNAETHQHQRQRQQQQPDKVQLNLMHKGALLLRLALAVAAVWAGGILKSNTARCLAEPTARLAVTVLQRIGRHRAAAGMRLALLQPIAAFAAELVLAAAGISSRG